MPTRPLIEFSNVTLRLGDRLLFKNSNWAFECNQNWVLVGGNGSGKTLLGRAIAGEIPVVAGEIKYHLQPPQGKVPEDCVRLVSFEMQKAAAGDAPDAVRWFSMEQEMAGSVSRYLSQEMVEEINPFELRAHREQPPGVYRRHRKKIVELMQIQNLLRRSLLSLSNGEMRKILIARALLRKPKLLILDDAFTGLDAEFGTHLKSVIEALMRSRSVRVLLIDSLLHEVPKGITNLLMVKDCRIVAQGAYREMMRHAQIKEMFHPGLPASRKNSHRVKRAFEPAKREELVRLENVTVRYSGKDILSGIDWVIRRGENWALLGPNGSGKSTLLSLINGDNPQAYANSVYIFGRRRGSGESIWKIKKRIGAISPELHLHFPEDQTCLETVMSGFHGTSFSFRSSSRKQKADAKSILHRFSLSPLSGASFHSLSAGSQRMVLLARAVVNSPDLILLDEPCQGLDLRHRRMFLELVDSLMQSGSTTVVFVTHRKDEIPSAIRRTLRLKNGRVVRKTCGSTSGSPQDFIEPI